MRAAILFALILTASAWAKPAREAPKKAPSLPTESNWGTFTQDGPRVSLDGHRDWSASGLVRKDGRLELLWLELATGRTAPSVYRLEDGKAFGLWGWSLDSHVDEAGDLVGDTRVDTIYSTAPAKEPER